MERREEVPPLVPQQTPKCRVRVANAVVPACGRARVIWSLVFDDVHVRVRVYGLWQ